MPSFAMGSLNDLGRLSLVIGRMPSFGQPTVDGRVRHRAGMRDTDRDSFDIDAPAGR